MTPTLEFWFDYGSPYSYLADTQLEGLCARTNADLVYCPMLLGGIFKATGNRSPAQEPVEAKRHYGALEMRRWVEYYGVPFRNNPFFPINTLGIMRASVAAQQLGSFAPFHRAIYPAFWVDGLDLGDSEVLARVLEEAGLDPAGILASAAQQEVKDELRGATERAVARGVFGAPSFFVGDEIFFGADRLPFVERALLRESG